MFVCNKSTNKQKFYAISTRNGHSLNMLQTGGKILYGINSFLSITGTFLFLSYLTVYIKA